MELIARVEAIAVSGQPLDRVLDGILAEMARTGLRGASIALVNENRELYIAAAEGDLSEEVSRLRLPVGQGIMGRVALTGRPLIVDDLDRPGDGLKAANRNVGSNARMRSLVAVPIALDGAAFGVLEVDSQLPNRFDDEDARLLGGIAVAISGAIQQARPLRVANEELRRRVHELTRLQAAARVLTGSLDVAAVVEEVLRWTVDALNAPVSAILRRDEAGLRVAATSGEVAMGLYAGPPVPRGAAPEIDAAIDAGVPQQLPVEAVVAIPALGALVTEGRLRVALVAPMAWPGPGEDALLVAASAADRRFDEAERLLIENIAHIGELALSNAERLHSLEVMASLDALTGLANAPAFERALTASHPMGLSVIALDLDRLKEVNDAAGHEAGDETLRRVAATLQAVVASAGLVGRTGGDDFAVLLEGVDEDAALDLAERIRLAMHGLPVPYGVARVSIGVGVERRAVDARQVWLAASDAAATAKLAGGDVVVRAGPAQTSASQRRWQRQVDAILDGDALRVVPVYQPVVGIRGRDVVGYEALARVSGALDGGVEQLFAAAQRAGRARDLDWMCRRAALEGAGSLAAGTPLYINVGVTALLDPLHDVDSMLLLLEHVARPASDVVLELTERELVSDLPRLVDVLAAYRDEGFRFAIDDLGEGHSTLELLTRASPEYIKLASSLTRGRGSRGVEAAIAAVVTFAERSGATIIAEGIETDEHAAFVIDLGVELGQGWLLGRPAPLPVEASAAEEIGERTA